MSNLLSSSPSAGFAEVLGTMRFRSIRKPLTVHQLGRLVARTYKGDDWGGADSAYEADLVTVCQAMSSAGYLTPSPTLVTDTVKVTSAGRVASRSFRPRAVVDPWGRG